MKSVIRRTKISLEPLMLEAFKSTGYLTVNKVLLKQFGVLNAVVLSHYIDKYIYFRKKQKDPSNAWFYLRHDSIMNGLGITQHVLQKVKKDLREFGVLSFKMKGTPARQHFTINFTKLYKILFPVEQLGVLGTQQLGDLGTERLGVLGTHKDNINIIPLNNKNKNNKPKKINVDFAIFWDAYDRKVGNKNLTESRWNKLTDEERETIIKVLPDWIQQYGKEKQYRAFPQTFLNQRRWEDELIKTKPTLPPKKTIRQMMNGTPVPIVNSMLRYYDKALETFPGLDSNKISKNICTLYSWIVTNTSKSTIKNERFQEEVGPPEYIISLYIDWLSRQDWIDSVNENFFDGNSKMFNKFINDQSKEVGLHILTGGFYG